MAKYDYFYSTIKNAMFGLVSVEPKINMTDVFKNTGGFYCQVEILRDNPGYIKSETGVNYPEESSCDFMVLIGVQSDRKQVPDIRSRSHALADRALKEIADIDLPSFTTYSVKGVTKNLSINNIDIAEVTFPLAAENLHDNLMINGTIFYNDY